MRDSLRDELAKFNFTEKMQLVRDYNNALKENHPIECSLKQLVERHYIPANNSELLKMMKYIALNSAWITITEVDEYMKGNM
jgi:hypothetical protein